MAGSLWRDASAMLVRDDPYRMPINGSKPRSHESNALAPLWFDELTAREREVLEILARGHDNSEIASRLKISEKTARNHVSIIFSKLGVKKRAQAVVVLAREAGFGRGSIP